MHYPALILKAEGCYNVVFPDVMGCVSAGDSIEEAMENAREALDMHFEAMALDGDDIPLPNAIELHQGNEEYQVKGAVWILVENDINQYLGKAVRMNITLPQFLMKRIDQAVARSPKHQSRSGFLANAAIQMLSR